PVLAEVAAAQARTHARYARIRSCELATKTGVLGFERDLQRIKGAEGLPLEVLDSLRLLARARDEYLNAILDYNKAQFELYVSLGKPPAELLMRPAGTNGDAPRAQGEADDESDATYGLERELVIPRAVEERIIDLPTALQLAEAEN